MTVAVTLIAGNEFLIRLIVILTIEIQRIDWTKSFSALRYRYHLVPWLLPISKALNSLRIFHPRIGYTQVFAYYFLKSNTELLQRMYETKLQYPEHFKKFPVFGVAVSVETLEYSCMTSEDKNLHFNNWRTSIENYDSNFKCLMFYDIDSR